MATEALTVSEIEGRWRDLAGTLPGAGIDWLDDFRAQGLEQFRASGLPGPRLESWKYTNLPRALRDRSYTPAASAQRTSLDRVASLLPAESARLRLVFLDGRFSPDHSQLAGLPDGVTLAPLSQVLRDTPQRLEGLLQAAEYDRERTLQALNDALFDEGLLLSVASGIQLDTPVEVIFVGGTSEAAVESHQRLVVSIGRGAQATLVEHHQSVGSGHGLLNLVSDIHVAAGAGLTHLRVQETGKESVHLAGTHLQLERDARYRSLAFTSGAALSRHEIDATLLGENADITLDGAYLLRGRQHGDTTSVIRHTVPHTAARQTYKGALDDRARGVFQGRIVVEQDAQKTDGRMLNKTLLLSEKAEIDSKPELEIFADDVQCAHGATAGELDADALFYLRSRGLSQEGARALLVEAFVAELIEDFPLEALRPALLERLQHWLLGTN
ncbi:Fe-S cluster assembly protein SufD [Aquibaculum sediminis]|uniref:Fe-S cluster assembly protein SufD n=1 Tax=Aquibaculum sediminis TaxID=3231907 RepID=UPI0034542FA3